MTIQTISLVSLSWIVLGFIGIYPLTYIAFLFFGADAQRTRLRSDFQLFGLVDDNELEDTIEKLYKNVYSPFQFVIFIALIILSASILLYAYFNRETFGGESSSQIIELVFFSFLGAYIFSVQELIRRYNTFDLQPQVYSSILVRILISAVLTFYIGSFTLQGDFQFETNNSNITQNEESGTATSNSSENVAVATPDLTWLAILAFATGIFPSDTLRWVLKQSRKIMRSPTGYISELPLRSLLGISIWHESRLSLMGIDNAQNIATVDIPKLLLTTQFDTQQVANWIDQAILYVKVGDRIDRFREAKVTTFHEFHRFMDRVEGSDQEKADQLSSLATVLGMSNSDELTRLREYSNYPNYTHIASFYEGAGQVGVKRAEESVLKLTGLGGIDRASKPLENINSSNTHSVPNKSGKQEALEKEVQYLESQLFGRSKDPVLYTRLGFAYIQQGHLEKAIARFGQALELNSLSPDALYGRSVAYLYKSNQVDENSKQHLQSGLQDISIAIEQNPSDAEAYNQRGLIYYQTGYLLQAIYDFDKALDFDPSLAIAYYNRGMAQMATAHFKQAADDFKYANMLGYKQAGLWVAWGMSLLALDEPRKAAEYLSFAITHDPSLPEAYANRGRAYMLLGEQYLGQAIIDLETAFEKDNSLWKSQHDLGEIRVKQKNYEAAINHFQQAIEISTTFSKQPYVLAQKNLAVAYNNLGIQNFLSSKYDVALTNFKKAIQARQQSTNENYILARINLANTHIQLGNEVEAYLEYQHLQKAGLNNLSNDEDKAFAELTDILGLGDDNLKQLNILLKNYALLDDATGLARTQFEISRFYFHRGDPAEAYMHFEQAKEQFESLQDEAALAELDEFSNSIFFVGDE